MIIVFGTPGFIWHPVLAISRFAASHLPHLGICRPFRSSQQSLSANPLRTSPISSHSLRTRGIFAPRVDRRISVRAPQIFDATLDLGPAQPYQLETEPNMSGIGGKTHYTRETTRLGLLGYIPVAGSPSPSPVRYSTVPYMYCTVPVQIPYVCAAPWGSHLLTKPLPIFKRLSLKVSMHATAN